MITIDGIQIISNPMLTPIPYWKRVRFFKSKKKRIRNKVLKDPRNYRLTTDPDQGIKVGDNILYVSPVRYNQIKETYLKE